MRGTSEAWTEGQIRLEIEYEGDVIEVKFADDNFVVSVLIDQIREFGSSELARVVIAGLVAMRLKRGKKISEEEENGVLAYLAGSFFNFRIR